jgi:large subunit ribosomal protein L22
MHAIAKNIRISSKKANLVAGLVRRKDVQDALDTLKFTQKKAAPLIAKVIASAAANAKDKMSQDISNLKIKEIIINEGFTLKRSVPISRGRTHPIRKRTAHIKVYLETKADTQRSEASNEAKAEDKKKPVPKTEEPKSEPTKTTK